MKRNELRKSLQKIKKGLKGASKATPKNEVSTQITPHHLFCTCKDTEGLSKMLYSSKQEAEEAIMYGKELNLRIYPCPSENGWHLTKG